MINKLDTLGLLAITPQTHVTFGAKVSKWWLISNLEHNVYNVTIDTRYNTPLFKYIKPYKIGRIMSLQRARINMFGISKKLL